MIYFQRDGIWMVWITAGQLTRQPCLFGRAASNCLVGNFFAELHKMENGELPSIIFLLP